MSAADVWGVVGKRKTTPINAIQSTEIAAHGKLCRYNQVNNTSCMVRETARSLVNTHKPAQVEWPRLELIFKDPARRDGDGVGHVQGDDADAEHGVDGLCAREREEAHNGSEERTEPDGVHGCLRVVVHAVKNGGEW